MYPDASFVALQMAVVMKRSKKKRARLSDKTFRLISQRGTLRDKFISDVRGSLEDLGVLMVRLERGGFAMILISALEGAPAVTAKNYLPERRDLATGKRKGNELWQELQLPPPDEED